MRNEITEVLSDIKDTKLIKNMIQNMNNRDLFLLMSLLELTDVETKQRWVNVYNSTMSI